MTLITCETIAAILVHVRRLGPSGPHYHGGADTPTLCGFAPAWDCKFVVIPENVTCRVCNEKMK